MSHLIDRVHAPQSGDVSGLLRQDEIHGRIPGEEIPLPRTGTRLKGNLGVGPLIIIASVQLLTKQHGERPSYLATVTKHFIKPARTLVILRRHTAAGRDK